MSSVYQDSATPAWLQYIIRNRKVVSLALMGIGAALLVAGLFLGWSYRWHSGAEVFACVVAGLAAMGCGLCYQPGAVSHIEERELTHLLVLVLGGVVGLVIAVMSVWRGVLWWKTISGGLEAWQGTEGYRLWVVLVELLLGLGILFASLLLARDQEQENPLLRRLLYGYVAILTGLLLLLILLVVNVFAYFYMPEPSDWTSSKLFTLSDQSYKILKALDQPVKIYFILTSRRDMGVFHEDVSGLLENMRGASDKVQTEIVLRDANPARMRELHDEFQVVGEPGLLLVYGTGKEGSHQFLKQEELYDRSAGRPGVRPPFKGEDAVMSAINHLAEGKAPVVYFLQGEGELDIGVSGQMSGPGQRATTLVSRLQKANYEVKGLQLSSVARPGGDAKLVVGAQVPDDAAAVVIAGAQRPLPDFTLQALRIYLNTPVRQEKAAKDLNEAVQKYLNVLSSRKATPDQTVTDLDKALQKYLNSVGPEQSRQAVPGLDEAVRKCLGTLTGKQAKPDQDATDLEAALRKYSNTPRDKGKLLVLAGVVTDPDGKMVPLGLEGLLREYNVDLGNNRILQLDERMMQLDRKWPPDRLLVMASGQESRNPLAAALGQYIVAMSKVRTVQPQREPPASPGLGNYVADTLLRSANQDAWAEDNLRDDPTRIVENYLANPQSVAKLGAKLSPQPLSVGVTVSEALGGMDRPDQRPPEQKPRLVVIGNADFVSDATFDRARGQLGDLYYTLCAGSLAWLREKPQSIGIPPRTRKFYQMNADTHLARMFLLPTGLMGMCIVGLGLGIWIVRRR